MKIFLLLFLTLEFTEVNILFNYFALRYAMFYNTLSKLSVQLLSLWKKVTAITARFLDATPKILMLSTEVI